MSNESKNLIQLFSKLLYNPQFLLALEMENVRGRLKNHEGRQGANGLLNLLAKEDGLTNAQIAEALDIKPSSVTAQVRRLEEMKLIKRETDETDKRMSRIFLTEEGKKQIEKQVRDHDDFSEKIFDSLSKEELKQLESLLSKLEFDNQDSEMDPRMLRRFAHPGFDQRMMREFRRGIKQSHKAFEQDIKEAMIREYLENFPDRKNPRGSGHWEDF